LAKRSPVKKKPVNTTTISIEIMIFILFQSLLNESINKKPSLPVYNWAQGGAMFYAKIYNSFRL
jgi:hypothetical protein